MIDSRADIHSSAKIAANVEIGPWSVIGPYVEIDEGCKIGPHVVIQGPTRIGKNNRIFQFSSIGEAPQDKKFEDEDTILEIGDNNMIREFVTLNRGTIQGGGATRIGSHNWIMAYVHIAHDCIVGNNIVFANNASLAGHVIVEDYATLSGFSGVHQFCTIGAYSFVAKASYVTMDVLPYLMVAGYEPKAVGLNSVGLQRREFSSETMATLKQAYKIIFREGKTAKEAISELEMLQEACPEIKLLIQGMKKSQRGIVR